MSYNFAFSPYFGFTKSYQNSHINILHISNIDRPKQTDLFIFFSFSLIWLINLHKKKKLLYDSLVLILNNFLLQLLQV